MADLHKAIRAIHNTVIYVRGETKENIIAKDIDGNEVTINWTNVCLLYTSPSPRDSV